MASFDVERINAERNRSSLMDPYPRGSDARTTSFPAALDARSFEKVMDTSPFHQHAPFTCRAALNHLEPRSLLPFPFSSTSFFSSSIPTLFRILHPLCDPTPRSSEMSNMSTPNSTLRQRGPKQVNKPTANGNKEDEDALKKALDELNKSVVNEWDYKLALGIITILAFVTRFFGINHPNEVVFDEVHFGKVNPKDNIDRDPTNDIRSSRLITFNEPTSSTSILPSENSCSPWSAG